MLRQRILKVLLVHVDFPRSARRAVHLSDGISSTRRIPCLDEQTTMTMSLLLALGATLHQPEPAILRNLWDLMTMGSHWTSIMGWKSRKELTSILRSVDRWTKVSWQWTAKLCWKEFSRELVSWKHRFQKLSGLGDFEMGYNHWTSIHRYTFTNNLIR